MKTSIEIVVKPFTVPNYVQAKVGTSTEEQSLELASLSAETLDQLCREFTADVFKKAKKQQLPESRQA